jgi:phosphoribosyl-dephospho-CoA transferase
MEVKVHDLLKVESVSCLVSDIPIPDWVHNTLERANWVVVRRDVVKDGMAPVGIRGSMRSLRFPAYLPMDAIVEKVEPELLVSQLRWKTSSRRSKMKALEILDELNAFYSSFAFSWGPTGSIGFELATGFPTVHEGSDIDIVLRAPKPLEKESAQALIDFHEQFPVRLDVQLETPFGAVSLVEYASVTGTILLRTSLGPCLVHNPWVGGEGNDCGFLISGSRLSISWHAAESARTPYCRGDHG